MIYTVIIEGQNIPVPEEIGGNDEAVKRALTPFYPEVSNSMITRVEKDGVTTITVVKRAGPKGSTGVDALIGCQGGKNPAIELYEHITEMEGPVDPITILEMNEQIDDAVSKGQIQGQAVEYATNRLAKSRSKPAPALVEGF